MKINKKNIFTIAKKEFLSFYNSSTAYILIVPFLLISLFLYFRTTFVFNQASLRSYFEILPYFLLFLAPTIAMRVFAQEQKNKTLELFFSHPISELEIVLGKFFGALGFYTSLLATTIILPITTLIFSKPDPGVIIAQYLGAIFLGGVFLSVGIAASSLTKSQVGSWLLSSAISFLLIIVGFEFVLLSLPAPLSAIFSQLAILPHSQNISRGLLDFRDILYFITLIAVFLTITIIKLSQRKTVENFAQKQKLNIALGLIIGLGFVLNLLMYSYPIRLDITKNRLFTLSKGTKQTLTELPDIVTINLYSTANIPGELQSSVQDVRDTLKDYEALAKGKIQIIERSPDKNKSDAVLATEDGIQEVQFNQYGSNSFAVSSGFFGATIYYGDQKEVIPFFQNTSDIEYQLTSLIRKLTVEDKPVLSLYTQPENAYDQSSSIAFLKDSLANQYEIESIDLADAESSPSGQTLLVYGIKSAVGATASAQIANHLDSGKNAILLLDNNTIDPNSGSATSSSTGLESLLADYGIKSNKDIVYDLLQNEPIRIGNQGLMYFIQYPFWVKASPAQNDFPAYGNTQFVSVAWPNSLDLEPKEGISLTQLLVTSKKAGVQTGSYKTTPQDVSEQSNFDLENLGQKTLAVAAQKGDVKLVVVADSDFIKDEFTQNAQGNLEFATNIINWASSDNVLASIRRKTGDNPVYSFPSQTVAGIVQYTNIFLPTLATAGFGAWYLLRRKKFARRTYKS